ncbi:MAG TPA: VOC family protein [Desulfobacterales bacterium]|nr:VOC family protein [Desulfobacterales bacterium]
MQPAPKTTNIILYCRKWGPTVRFYRDQLGLTVTFASDWFVEFRLNALSRLSIADEKRATVKSCGGRGVTLALEVEGIAALRESALKSGLAPTAIRSHPWGAWVFYLFDPEGHRLEFWQARASDEVSGPEKGGLVLI